MPHSPTSFKFLAFLLLGVSGANLLNLGSRKYALGWAVTTSYWVSDFFYWSHQ